MNKPLVSIIIPVYNAGEYLYYSVQSILSQTYSNLEILIFDDGSTDGCMNSIAHLKEPRIRLFNQENRGKAFTLNRALKEASGFFYAIQDADDISYPERVDRQVSCLLENPQIAAVFTGHDILLDGHRLAPRFVAKSVEQCREDIKQMHMPAHDPTGMYRMSIVSDICFEPTLKVAEGLDYILRIGERFPMIVLGECLYSYRVHLCSCSRLDPDNNLLMERRVIERACQRRGLDPEEYISSGLILSTKLFYRRSEAIVPHFMESVLDLRRAGRTSQAIRTALACFKLHPFDPYYYKPLAYLVTPLFIIKCYRYIKNKVKYHRIFIESKNK
jgi:glycosyltransferase involved in cell wall biosynthesis